MPKKNIPKKHPEKITNKDLKKTTLKKLSEEERKKISGLIKIEQSESFIGPIPPPHILDKYDEIIPNGAERIMKMAENQSSHRIQMEKNVILKKLKESSRGQLFGFILVLFIIIIITFAIIKEQIDLAKILGGITIVSVASNFCNRKNKPK